MTISPTDPVATTLTTLDTRMTAVEALKIGTPTVSPASGNTSTTFTAIDPAAPTGGAITLRQWLLAGTAIGSGTTVVPSTAGQLTRQVGGTRPDGSTFTITSAPVAVAAVALAPTNSVLPAITGTAQEGQALSVSNGTWANTPTSFTYQWMRAGAPIAGAVNATRTLVTADVGFAITCTVTATNAAGSNSATSAATAAVIAAAIPVPVNSVLPAISGTPNVGQTLTSTPGSWTNSPTSYAYQWRRAAVDIAGAAAASYALVAADAGNAITCRVSATNAGGATTATSNALSAIGVPAAPALTVTAGNGQNTLAWTDGATGGAALTSHNLYAGPSAGALTLVGAITTGSPYIDTGLTNGTARYYAITAVNSVGESPQSTVQSGTPAASSGSFTAFTPTARAASVIAAHTTTPSAGKQYWIDWMIRRIQSYPEFNQILQITIPGDTDPGAALVNIVNPGVHDAVKIGSPTFAPGVGMSTTSAANRLDSTISLSALDPSNYYIGGILSGTSGTSGDDMGAVYDGTTNGVVVDFVGARGRTFGALQTRATLGNVAVGSPVGFFALGNQASNSVIQRQGQRAGGSTAPAIVAPTSGAAPTTLHFLGVNGLSTFSNQTLAATIIATGTISDDTITKIRGDITTYLRVLNDGLAYGIHPISAPGIGASTVTVDLLCYSGVPGSINAAIAAARRGRSVAVVLEGHEAHLGGVSGSGGLGYTDCQDQASFGGLERSLRDRARVIEGLAIGSAVQISPNAYRQAIREQLARYNIPVFTKAGVVSVTSAVAGNNDRNQTSMTTLDGRVFNFSDWHDGSYMGDFLAMAGIPFNLGREAKGEDGGYSSGYRGGFQLTSGSTNLVLSPYVTDGNSASGLLPTVFADTGEAICAGDSRVQSMNIRVTTNNGANPEKRIPFPTAYVSGVNPLWYEPLLRFSAATTAAGGTVGINDLTGIKPAGLVNDLNNNGTLGISTDLPGSGTEYVQITGTPQQVLAGRLAFNAKLRAYTLGYFTALAWSGDARIASTTVTAFRALGMDCDHYVDPDYSLGEMMFVPHMMYIREGRRAIGLLKYNVTDFGLANGTPMRSTNTVSIATYSLDKHVMQLFATTVGGTPTIVYEPGGGGGAPTFPLPLELFIADRTISANGSWSFCASATSMLLGAIRMEPTAGLSGQAMGVLAALRKAGSYAAYQDVPYANLRAALLAEPETKGVVIPQTMGGQIATALAISGTPSAATNGAAYNWTPTASGGTTPYTFAITAGALPTGLSLNTSTGAITGTPTVNTTANFTITVTDSANSTAALSTSITVSAAVTPSAGTAFDPSFNTNANIVYSNGNKTVTNTSTSTTLYARSVAAKTAGGPYYWEVVPSAAMKFSLMDSAVGANGAGGVNGVDLLYYSTTNFVYDNAGAAGTKAMGSSIVAGDVVQFVYRPDTQQIFTRKNGTGNWNNTAGADPTSSNASTNGGLSTAGLSAGAYLYVGLTGGLNATIHTSTTEFAYTPPTGAVVFA